MATIAKTFDTMQQAGRYQNRLYNKHWSVKLTRAPMFTEAGVYTWEVGEKPVPSCVVVTGDEKYKVIDDTTGGEQFFGLKGEAYRHMAILQSLGRTYRLIVRE